MTRLEQLRLDANLSRDALGERAGVNAATIWRLEKGKRDGRLDTLSKLATALESTPSQLLREAPPIEEAA